jgi:hypothetical protein
MMCRQNASALISSNAACGAEGDGAPVAQFGRLVAIQNVVYRHSRIFEGLVFQLSGLALVFRDLM